MRRLPRPARLLRNKDLVDHRPTWVDLRPVDLVGLRLVEDLVDRRPEEWVDRRPDNLVRRPVEWVDLRREVDSVHRRVIRWVVRRRADTGVLRKDSFRNNNNRWVWEVQCKVQECQRPKTWGAVGCNRMVVQVVQVVR